MVSEYDQRDVLSVKKTIKRPAQMTNIVW